MHYGNILECLSLWSEVQFFNVQNSKKIQEIRKPNSFGLQTARKKHKIAFLAVTPFIVKSRFEKYRYLLTAVPSNILLSEMFLLLLTVIVLCLSCLKKIYTGKIETEGSI